MKQLYSIVFFLGLSLAVLAQGYRILQPNTTQFYQGTNGAIRAIELEDTILLSGADTIFFNFNSIRIDSINCTTFQAHEVPYTSAGGSWLGNRMIARSNGDYFLQNQLNETIIIRTDVKLGDRWTMFTIESGDYIEAEVIDSSMVNLLGVTENALTISLTAFEQGGAVINDYPLNGFELVLLQSSGLYQSPDWYLFPEDTTTYTRTDRGILTRGEIYNYEVGDTWHYRDYSFNSTSENFAYVLNTVIRKQALAADAVEYDIARVIYDYGGEIYDAFGNPTVTISNDTITKQYTFLNAPLYNFMPEEVVVSSTLEEYFLKKNPADYNGRAVIQYRTYEDLIQTGPECYFSPTTLDYNNTSITYIEGVGSFTSVTRPFRQGQVDSMFYFQKGAEIFGEPFTPFEPLVGLVDITTIQGVNVFPNPAQDYVELSFNSIGSNELVFGIYDLTGELVLPKRRTYTNSGANSYNFDVSDLPAGMYFLRMQTQNEVYTRKFYVE